MNELIGKKITAIRPMTPEELKAEEWYPPHWQVCVAIELEGGIVLYASQDSEGNGPGALFGYEGNRSFLLLPGVAR